MGWEALETEEHCLAHSGHMEDEQMDRRNVVLETYQMATQGKVLYQGLTQGLTNLGFPWLSQAEQ